jgi:hypothetical protein
MTKYETPQLTAMPPAINAIQNASGKTTEIPPWDGVHDDGLPGYADWE